MSVTGTSTGVSSREAADPANHFTDAGATGPAGMLQDMPQGPTMRELVHQPAVHLPEAVRLRMRRMMP